MCKNLFIVLIASWLLLVQGNLHAQTGLNFQGVARSSSNVILASQPISIRLSILQGSASGNVEYTEIRKLTTNPQGLFTAVIGDADAISSLGNFNSINWKNTPKFLKIEMDPNAGNNFTIIGTTQFQYVAYAQFANSVNAENIVGILPIEKGGTGVTSITSLMSSLELDKKVNTTELIHSLNFKVDKVEGKVLSSNDYTNAEKTKLASIVGTNTGDQDLSSYATVTALALKANSSDINSSLLLKANIVDLDNGLSIKENSSNKSNAIDLGGNNPSDILFPTQKAVKQYVLANSAAGGVADGGISTIKLADGAVTYSKFQNLPTNTILGNTSSSTASMQAIATTGSNNVVLSNSPTISSPILITPDIGNAIASSINNVSINTLNGTASITVRGETLLRGNNNGDDAPNQRYESLLTDGIVSLNTDQPISGKKTFFNDIQMGNIGGVGSTSPTTINFANGSKLGDVQNINEGSPDNVGSIDLYAPDGAKWVQLNYGNSNYISVGPEFAIIDVNGKEWKFDNYGLTTIPSHVFFGGSIFFSQDGITDNTDASIVNSGPLLQVKVRDITEEEKSQDLEDYGIELNFADKSEILMNDDAIESFVRYTDATNDWESNLKINPNNLTYMFFNHTSRDGYYWVFDGETLKSSLPGDLILNDRKRIDFISGDPSVTNAYIYSDGPFIKIHTRVATSDEISSDMENGINIEYNNNNVTVNSSGVGMNVHNENSGSDTFVNLSESSFNFYSNDNTNNQNRWYFDGSNASTNLPGALFLNGNIETTGNLKLGNTLFPNTSGNPGDVLTIDAQTGNAVWQLPTSNSITNQITGVGSIGQISIFNGVNSINGDSKLFWDNSYKRLGIGISAPNYPLELNQEVEDEFGLYISSPPRGVSTHAYGTSIGFRSNFDLNQPGSSKSGSFQLDSDGNMVFRTMQNDMFFDNFNDPGVGNINYSSINFRIGPEQGIKKGMNLNSDGDLHVDGIVQSGGTTLTSDIRLKKNILPLNKVLNVIQKLNPVSYQKKQTIESDNYSINENGFIAQELQKVLPMLVHESTDKEKLLSVNYTAIIPILTKGIQEQQAQIEQLKKEMKVLKKLMLDLNKKK